MTSKTSSDKDKAPAPKAARKDRQADSGETKPEKKHKKEKKDGAKLKVVRDSFTMPQTDYDLIPALKEKALKAGLHVKKSELLRAGLRALDALSAAQLKRTMADLEKIKTGRPKKA